MRDDDVLHRRIAQTSLLCSRRSCGSDPQPQSKAAFGKCELLGLMRHVRAAPFDALYWLTYYPQSVLFPECIRTGSDFLKTPHIDADGKRDGANAVAGGEIIAISIRARIKGDLKICSTRTRPMSVHRRDAKRAALRW